MSSIIRVEEGVDHSLIGKSAIFTKEERQEAQLRNLAHAAKTRQPVTHPAVSAQDVFTELLRQQQLNRPELKRLDDQGKAEIEALEQQAVAARQKLEAAKAAAASKQAHLEMLQCRKRNIEDKLHHAEMMLVKIPERKQTLETDLKHTFATVEANSSVGEMVFVLLYRLSVLTELASQVISEERVKLEAVNRELEAFNAS